MHIQEGPHSFSQDQRPGGIIYLYLLCKIQGEKGLTISLGKICSEVWGLLEKKKLVPSPFPERQSQLRSKGRGAKHSFIQQPFSFPSKPSKRLKVSFYPWSDLWKLLEIQECVCRKQKLELVLVGDVGDGQGWY